MPPHKENAPKRKQKVLNYTSEECINRLLNRGYVLNIDLRNTLDAVLFEHAQKDESCHTRAFWEAHQNDHLSSVPETHGICIYALCACLCSLYIHEINYINLVIILCTFDAQKWKNVYRFCYLEWSRHFNDTPLWIYTPRSFASLMDTEVYANSLLFLQHMIPDTPNEQNSVRSLFLVNRLYQYMLPNA